MTSEVRANHRFNEAGLIAYLRAHPAIPSLESPVAIRQFTSGTSRTLEADLSSPSLFG
jgi:hypothetical protein